MQDISALFKQFASQTTELIPKESHYGLLETHFGGKPFATTDSEAWPVCKECKQGMIFVCQIALNSDQQAQFNLAGLIQLFVCPRCHEFGKLPKGTFNVRQYEKAKDSDYKELPVKHNVKKSPVYKWLANVSYEVQEFGADEKDSFLSMPDTNAISDLLEKTKDPILKPYSKIVDSWLDEDQEEQYEDAVQQQGMTTESAGLQLGGYPNWQQAEGLQLCKKCKEPMQLFLQIDGETCWIGTDGFAILMHCKKDHTEFELIISGT